MFSLFIHQGFLLAPKDWLNFPFDLLKGIGKVGFLINPVAYAEQDKRWPKTTGAFRAAGEPSSLTSNHTHGQPQTRPLKRVGEVDANFRAGSNPSRFFFFFFLWDYLPPLRPLLWIVFSLLSTFYMWLVFSPSRLRVHNFTLLLSKKK